eukprot:scaffold978_cov392-Prasinococcus_capsulatus_cf.AAC.21
MNGWRADRVAVPIHWDNHEARDGNICLQLSFERGQILRRESRSARSSCGWCPKHLPADNYPRSS